MINQNKCSSIELLGVQNEDDASNLQSQFSIGIIIESKMGDTSPFMPSKITDNIQQHDKIICITPEHSFLSEFGKNRSGFYICEYNKTSIKNAISRALSSNEIIEDDSIAYFNPKRIANKYQLFFERLMSNTF